MLNNRDLKETLEAYIDGNFNIHTASAVTHIPVTTIHQRLHKMDKLTGLNHKNLWSLLEIAEKLDISPPENVRKTLLLLASKCGRKDDE